MNDATRGALILAAGIVTASAIYVYFSPYQSCVRGYSDHYKNTAQNPLALAQRLCAKMPN